MENNKRRPIKANELSETTRSSMRTRIIAGAIALVPALLSIFIGDWLFFVAIIFILAVAVYEILGVINKRTIIAYLLYFVVLSMIVCWPLFQGLLFHRQEAASWHVYSYFDSLFLPIIVLVVGVFLVFLLVVIYKDVTVRDACFLCTIGIVVALGLQSMLFIRYFRLAYPSTAVNPPYVLNYENTVGSSLLLFYVLIATFFTDIGAYFIGIFFGKNKMNERISPKKTWEGFAGGICISAGFSLAFGLGLAFSGNPMVKYLDAEHWYNILILSVTLPFFATLGDFVFSSIKRYYDIKDFGNIIPGHGGILDRLDSLFFTFIVAALYVLIFTRAMDGGGGNPLV